MFSWSTSAKVVIEEWTQAGLCFSNMKCRLPTFNIKNKKVGHVNIMRLLFLSNSFVWFTCFIHEEASYIQSISLTCAWVFLLRFQNISQKKADQMLFPQNCFSSVFSHILWTCLTAFIICITHMLFILHSMPVQT